MNNKLINYDPVWVPLRPLLVYMYLSRPAGSIVGTVLNLSGSLYDPWSQASGRLGQSLIQATKLLSKLRNLFCILGITYNIQPAHLTIAYLFPVYTYIRKRSGIMKYFKNKILFYFYVHLIHIYPLYSLQ